MEFVEVRYNDGTLFLRVDEVVSIVKYHDKGQPRVKVRVRYDPQLYDLGFVNDAQCDKFLDAVTNPVHDDEEEF